MRTPAEVFPPGEFIRDELEARGWTQADLASIMGRPIQAVNLIINGKKSITADTARELAEAFATSAQFWLNLQSSYRLSTTKGPEGKVRRRAHLYEIAPVRDMEQRQWIRATDSHEALEAELRQFFGVDSLDRRPQTLVAARAGGQAEKEMTPAQVAWCRRALQLASVLPAKRFLRGSVTRAAGNLRQLLAYAEEARKVPRVLAEAGIRLVIVEHLPGTRIDGAALWLDSNSPVVALSLRYDRIDWFWFTLCHELAHVLHEDAQAVLDLDLLEVHSVGPSEREAMEAQANMTAREMLIPKADLDSFILRVKPYYSKTRIIQFAQCVGVHPGIVVGQLQHLGQVGYPANREMLVAIRDIVIQETLTDGWGHVGPVAHRG